MNTLYLFSASEYIYTVFNFVAEFGGWVGVFLGKKISTTYIALSWPSLYCHNTHIGSIADANIINPLCMNGICHSLKKKF